MEKGNL